MISLINGKKLALDDCLLTFQPLLLLKNSLSIFALLLLFSPTEVNLDHLCDHSFGTVPWNHVGISVAT